MATLANKRKVQSGRIFNAYFDSVLYQTEVEKGRPFGTGSYDVTVTAFDFNNKTYAVLGYDHFNGHFSNYKDKSAVYGLFIAEIKS
jgi:hypothetical protein